MAEISIGAAVGEGFDLIRRRPWAVISWGAAQVGFTLVGLLILFPAMASIYAPMMKSMMAGGTPTPPSPGDMSGFVQIQALSNLFNLVSLFVNSVIYCAVFRAVLHPERSQFAYLRVGAPELFLFLMLIASAIAFFIGLFAAMIPIGIVAAILFGLHAGPVGAIFAAVAGVAAFVALVIVAIRMALIGPMMVDDGQFHLTEAWALTRGRVASLFAVGLVVFLILMVVEIVLGLIALAFGFGVLATLAGGLSHLPAFFQQSPAAILPKLIPLLVVGGLAGIPVAGGLLAIMGAPWARAYRDLKPPRDLAETFA